MHLLDIVFNLIKVGPDAVDAVSDDLGYKGGILLTAATFHCLSSIRMVVLSPGCTLDPVHRIHTQIGGLYGLCDSVARGIFLHLP